MQPAAGRTMTSVLRAWAAISLSGLLLQSIDATGAELLTLRSGLYEIAYRLELPHLERWAIDRATNVCLSSAAKTGEIPIPVLSANNPFEKCAAANVKIDNATFQYDIVCPGRGSAKAHAIYALGIDKFAGRVAMVMGAKNMTMTEVQRATRLGDCEPFAQSSAARFRLLD
jgi:hypothetical protein